MGRRDRGTRPGPAARVLQARALEKWQGAEEPLRKPLSEPLREPSREPSRRSGSARKGEGRSAQAPPSNGSVSVRSLPTALCQRLSSNGSLPTALLPGVRGPRAHAEDVDGAGGHARQLPSGHAVGAGAAAGRGPRGPRPRPGALQGGCVCVCLCCVNFWLAGLPNPRALQLSPDTLTAASDTLPLPLCNCKCGFIRLSLPLKVHAGEELELVCRVSRDSVTLQFQLERASKQ